MHGRTDVAPFLRGAQGTKNAPNWEAGEKRTLAKKGTGPPYCRHNMTTEGLVDATMLDLDDGGMGAGLGGSDLGGARVAVLVGVEALDGGDAGEDDPDEEGESNSSLPRPAPVPRAAPAGDAEGSGHGDGAGEPEEGGDGEEAEADELVEELGREAGDGEEVRDDEEGPDRVEDAEGYRAGGPEYVGDIGEEAELKNIKQRQHDEGDGDETEGHGCCGGARSKS